ncbi:MAG: EamA family transporter [Terracidiphilus sp.]
MTWLVYSLIVIFFWGIVGFFQKLGANHSTPDSLMVWTTIGYVVLLPFLFTGSHLTTLPPMAIVVGLLAGFANGLGAWFLLIALNKGAAASVAVPFTALYPLLTIVLAVTFLGEGLTRTQAVGISLALAAAVLLSYEKEAPKEI